MTVGHLAPCARFRVLRFLSCDLTKLILPLNAGESACYEVGGPCHRCVLPLLQFTHKEGEGVLAVGAPHIHLCILNEGRSGVAAASTPPPHRSENLERKHGVS